MRRDLISLLAVALLVAACGGGAAPGADPDDDPDDRAAPDAPEEEPPPTGDFDRDSAESEAQALLGTTEDDIEEDGDTRIVRRGDEQLPGTMDLRPGRRNLELDDDGSGTFVVTRVTVEVPDGEDPLVIE